MSDQDNKQLDLAGLLATLREDPEAFPWPERQELVKGIAVQLADNATTSDHLAILLLLADDTKWEVRKEVADCLLHIPEENFPQFAALLGEDRNSYVRASVERAHTRRQRGAESARKKRKSLAYIEDEYTEIERIHGPLAARKARRAAERLYDTLVAATVHDMRNVMAPIKLSVETIMRNIEDGECSLGFIEGRLSRVQNSLEMMERMLEDMRTYSMPAPKQKQSERLRSVIDEAITMAQEALKGADRLYEHAIVLRTGNIDSKLTMNMVRDQIVRAIANIIINAYDAFALNRYDFEEGEIQITAFGVKDNCIEISVQDNGKGIPEEDLVHLCLFRPGKSAKPWGSGFGIPIAEKIARYHGGSLAIESEEGAGTTVTMTLPRNGKGDAS